MGNPLDGDARQSAGKTNRTSSRKIYSVCRHFYLDGTTEKGFNNKEYFFGSIR